MNIRLSICIPVYNCSEFIGQALDSILPQTDRTMEVIVYDGGSTDGTPEVMESYSRQWPNLRYFRGAERGGIDADLVTCVSFATGEYCWLFSGDDVMRPEAVARAIEWLKLRQDVYICKHTICSKRMVFLRDHAVLAPDEVHMADLADSAQRIEWFRRAFTTEAFFSFLSGLIVRRQKWLAGTLPREFSNSCWGHVARYFGLIPSGLLVCYVAEIWLDQRGENDSFADRGLVNRLGIAIEGYTRLADHFFGHRSAEARHVRKTLRNEFTLLGLLATKKLCGTQPNREDVERLGRLVCLLYSDATPSALARRILYFATPYWLLQCVRLAYQPIKHVRRALRP
jgi:abequosyltransferase